MYSLYYNYCLYWQIVFFHVAESNKDDWPWCKTFIYELLSNCATKERQKFFSDPFRFVSVCVCFFSFFFINRGYKCLYMTRKKESRSRWNCNFCRRFTLGWACEFGRQSNEFLGSVGTEERTNDRPQCAVCNAGCIIIDSITSLAKISSQPTRVSFILFSFFFFLFCFVFAFLVYIIYIYTTLNSYLAAREVMNIHRISWGGETVAKHSQFTSRIILHGNITVTK